MADPVKNEKQQEATKKSETDVIIFNSELDFPSVERLLLMIHRLGDKRRKNLALWLTTMGGSPDDAYRLVRFIKAHYEKLTLLVFSFCKSAGTLIALGADDIVMGPMGELGPIDIQLTKIDDFRRTSGLSYRHTFNMIGAQTTTMFESTFLDILNKSDSVISTKTAGDLAAQIVIGIMSRLTEHIDPLRLGEMDRATQITNNYGVRINDNKDLVEKLTVNYPSHEFVIDFKEAKELFGDRVRTPKPKEAEFADGLYNFVRFPRDSDKAIIQHINPIKEDETKAEEPDVSANGADQEGDGAGAAQSSENERPAANNSPVPTDKTIVDTAKHGAISAGGGEDSLQNGRARVN